MQKFPLAHLLLLPLAAFAGPRPVWTGPEVTLLGTPSRDGRYLSYVDTASGNLAVRDLQLNTSALLTSEAAGSTEFAYFSAIAPDGKSIAYAWFNSQGFYELRVLKLDTRESRTLFRNEEAGFVQPCGWTPDGKSILTLLFRRDNTSQIALLPAGGGVPKILRSLSWVYPKKMDISPDGRYLIYDSFTFDNSGERTLYLLSLDGASETRLLKSPGNHLFPLWVRDGSAIVYASDESGTMDAWMLPMQGGVAGTPRLIERNLGRMLPLGITDNNRLIYGVRSGAEDLFNVMPGEPASKAERVAVKTPGRNTSPAWSQDGSNLAMLTRAGAENFGQDAHVITVLNAATHAEKILRPALAHLERLHWAPDGSLLVSGSDNKGRSGLFQVDANGAAKPLFIDSHATFRGVPGAYSPDGKTLYFLAGGELRARTGETTAAVYKGRAPHAFAVSPEGELAVAEPDSIVIVHGPTIPFPGASELEWGEQLIAARGRKLYRIPLDSAPMELDLPGNLEPGFAPHPDGKRITVTAGKKSEEVWALDLNRPLDVPTGLDAFVPAPDKNPMNAMKAALGKKLFFDPRLSEDGKTACATCHDPNLAFSDLIARDRRSPRLLNRAWGQSFFWDGRAATLEDQVMQPIENPHEMGGSVPDAAKRVGVSRDAMQEALATYIRTIFSGNSPYDRYVAGDSAALSEEEREGLKLFRGKAQCVLCHMGPNLSDERFHNTGIGAPGQAGRAAVTHSDLHFGAFKTPGLREVARTPPYMHDGSLATLEDVIDYYDKGGKTNPHLDPEMRELHLTVGEKRALRKFLDAFTGTVKDGY